MATCTLVEHVIIYIWVRRGARNYSATVLRYTVDGAAPMYYYRRVAVLIAYSYYILGCGAAYDVLESISNKRPANSSLPLATFGVATLNSAALPPLG